MGRRAFALLVAVQMILSWSLPGAAASDGEGLLPPLLSPIINMSCDGVQCGKGRCKASADHAFGFVCECEAGWKKVHFGDHFQFLPCIIPNCTFNYSCSKSTMSPSSTSSSLPLSNRSLFDPCTWSYCGDGTCLKTSEFGHQCNCNVGRTNLLNSTVLPCFEECVYGADCASIGLVVANGSSSSSKPSLSGNTSTARPKCPRSTSWIFLSMVTLVVITRH